MAVKLSTKDFGYCRVVSHVQGCRWCWSWLVRWKMMSWYGPLRKKDDDPDEVSTCRCNIASDARGPQSLLTTRTLQTIVPQPSGLLVGHVHYCRHPCHPYPEFPWARFSKASYVLRALLPSLPFPWAVSRSFSQCKSISSCAYDKASQKRRPQRQRLLRSLK